MKNFRINLACLPIATVGMFLLGGCSDTPPAKPMTPETIRSELGSPQERIARIQANPNISDADKQHQIDVIMKHQNMKPSP